MSKTEKLGLAWLIGGWAMTILGKVEEKPEEFYIGLVVAIVGWTILYFSGKND